MPIADTEPQWGPVDEQTRDLLSLIAAPVTDHSGYTQFLRLCKIAADQNDGLVSVQTVRNLCVTYGVDIDSRRYSAYWSKACAKGGPMVTTNQWDICDDRKSHNSGKPQRLRRWVAA